MTLINVIDFFKSLPKKKCHKCGLNIDEQAECYGNLCFNCDHPAR